MYTVDTRTIGRWAEKFGLTESHMFKTINKDEFIKDYETMSMVELSRKYNVKRHTITIWKNKLNLNDKIDRPMKIGEVIDFLNKYNLTALNINEYKTLASILTCETLEGYKVKVRIGSLKQGTLPQIIETSNPNTLENIKLYCKLNRNDYVFMENEYKGSKKYYKWKYIGELQVENQEFYMTWDTFYLGYGHPEITMSRGERVVNKILLDNGINFKSQYWFDDLRSDKNCVLRFDFAVLNDKNELEYLIEYDSIIHEKSIEYFGGDEEFERRKRHDKIKNIYCLKHNIPLIRLKESKIKFKINFEDIYINTTKYLLKGDQQIC